MRPCATTGDAEMTEEESAFLLSVLAEKRPGTHLEIGTAAGGTLWQMMRACKGVPFVVVDPMRYFEGQYALVCKNLTTHGEEISRVDFRQMTSEKAFKMASERGERFSFMLIDGAHKIRYVTDDFRWTRLLDVGGIVCLHDYAPAYRGVFTAANRFLSKNPHFRIVGQAGTLLALQKIAPAARLEITCIDRFVALLLAPLFQLEQTFLKRFGS